jgi:prepilin-type N-terminal cleavage/methylation domain-containing protein
MRSDGFSLVEVLVAIAIVAVGVASLAQLLVAATGTARAARVRSIALLIAQQKLEELQGAPVLSDPSPAQAIFTDTPPYVDRLATRSGVYTRRWSIDAIPGTDAFVLQVFVVPGSARLVSVRTRNIP